MLTGVHSDLPPAAGVGERLELNSPLGSAAVRAWVDEAVALNPSSIVDYGCGWAEMLNLILEALPHATGVGIDEHEPDVIRGRARAERLGIGERVTLHAADASSLELMGDLVINLGAYHVFGSIAEALVALAARTNDGGHILFGCEYWEHRPTPEQLAASWGGVDESECLYLPQIIERIHNAGLHVLALHASTRAELDDYELGHLRERTEWAILHPSHPVGAELDEAVQSWINGHRTQMGFITLLLG